MAREFRRLDEPQVPANSLTFFLGEALRRMWASKRTSSVAVSMIAMSLLVLGVFLLVAENIEHSIAQWQGRTRVNVYFEPDATPAQISNVEQWLRGRRELARAQLVTREEALQRFRIHFRGMTNLLAELDDNPFPPSYEVEVSQHYVESSLFERHMDLLRTMPGVEQVQYDWEWLTQLRRLVYLINVTGLVAGGILAIAAAFTIANVIRLTMMLYKEEIGIMRLVGATERIIRGPFLFEGIVQGTLGGVTAVLLLYALFALGRSSLPPSGSFLWGFFFATFLPWTKIAALIAGGTFAGWFGSWLSVRERTEE